LKNSPPGFKNDGVTSLARPAFDLMTN